MDAWCIRVAMSWGKGAMVGCGKPFEKDKYVTVEARKCVSCWDVWWDASSDWREYDAAKSNELESSRDSERVPEVDYILADNLAGRISRTHPESLAPSSTPLWPPACKIWLLTGKSAITSKWYHTLSNHLHIPKLKEHIIQKAQWTEATFDAVD